MAVVAIAPSAAAGPTPAPPAAAAGAGTAESATPAPFAQALDAARAGERRADAQRADARRSAPRQTPAPGAARTAAAPAAAGTPRAGRTAGSDSRSAEERPGADAERGASATTDRAQDLATDLATDLASDRATDRAPDAATESSPKRTHEDPAPDAANLIAALLGQMPGATPPADDARRGAATDASAASLADTNGEAGGRARHSAAAKAAADARTDARTDAALPRAAIASPAGAPSAPAAGFTDALSAARDGSSHRAGPTFGDLAGPALPLIAQAATPPELVASAGVAATEARLPIGPGHPAFAQQLGAQLTTFVRDGVEFARIQLHPAELGPITVQIKLDGQAAQVHLAAERGDTRQALDAALPTLAGSLREAGLTLAGGGVFQQPRDSARPGGEQAAAGRAPSEGGASATERVAPADVPATVVRRRGVVDLIA